MSIGYSLRYQVSEWYVLVQPFGRGRLGASSQLGKAFWVPSVLALELGLGLEIYKT